MGDYAEDELARQYPGVFGDRRAAPYVYVPPTVTKEEAQKMVANLKEKD